tara:strand:+ start:2838 stop:3296 length:459 start_codon:yes stop_codon:yes gene_type:complete
MKKIDIPDWIEKEIWIAFIKHRKITCRKPMTERAEFLILKKLEKAKDEGYNPNDLLDEAIEKGWQTIYPKPHQLIKHDGSHVPPMYRGSVLNPDYQEWLANKEYMELNGTADTSPSEEARNAALRSVQRANFEHKVTDLAGKAEKSKPRRLN